LQVAYAHAVEGATFASYRPSRIIRQSLFTTTMRQLTIMEEHDARIEPSLTQEGTEAKDMAFGASEKLARGDDGNGSGHG